MIRLVTFVTPVGRISSTTRYGRISSSVRVLDFTHSSQRHAPYSCLNAVSVCFKPNHETNHLSRIKSLEQQRIYLHDDSYYNYVRKPKPTRKPQHGLTKILIGNICLLCGFGIAAIAAYMYAKKWGKPQEDIHIDSDFGTNGRMIQKSGYLLPEFASESLTAIQDFKVRDTDLFVCSFPKSGTTWVQYIVQLLEQECGILPANNLEAEFPYLEYVYPGVKSIEDKEGSRRIKTHLPFELLPLDVQKGKGKVIYIARNPKDVSVSYFHFVRMLSELKYDKDFSNFHEKFVSDKVAYSPWSRHVEIFWEHRDNPNVLFLTYEDLHKFPERCVEQMASFLGLKVNTESINRVCLLCKFPNMQRNPNVNYEWWDELGIRKKSESKFLRKGIVGDWENYYSTEMTERTNRLATNLELAGLKFHDSN